MKPAIEREEPTLSLDSDTLAALELELESERSGRHYTLEEAREYARQRRHDMGDGAVWIALVEAVPANPDEMPDMSGAYTNALVLATSEKEALQRISTQLAAEGFDIVRAGDVERYSDRIARCTPEIEVQEAAERAATSGEVEFGVFFTWSDDDSAVRTGVKNAAKSTTGLPTEDYSDHRAAEFIPTNVVDVADYETAKDCVRDMGVDPATIRHVRPKK